MKNLEIFDNPASGQKAIYIIARNGHKVIDLKEILLCKADSNYTEILLNDDERIIVSRSLCVFENLLKAYSFFRCSASYLINLCKPGSFNRYHRRIYMANHEISVPKAKCHEVFPVLTAFGFREIIRH